MFLGNKSYKRKIRDMQEKIDDLSIKLHDANELIRQLELRIPSDDEICPSAGLCEYCSHYKGNSYFMGPICNLAKYRCKHFE